MKTILLAEDELIVRLNAEQVLRDHGYIVLAAESGEEALQVWDLHPDEIHLLFTDLQMAGMNGAKLAEALTPRKAGLKTLFTSGSGEAYVDAALTNCRPCYFLPKPYTAETLLRAVNSVLEDHPHPPGDDWTGG